MKGLARYESDLKRLIDSGSLLFFGLVNDVSPDQIKRAGFSAEDAKKLPNPRKNYQAWYSESLALVIQLLPDRADDFREYYSSARNRKEILASNYTMSDYLRGVSITRGGQSVVEPSAAMRPLEQQLNIVKAIGDRFKSSLFDIQALVQADLLDDELHSAEELNKNGYARAAGAVAGVVLEAHLGTVCDRHGITPKKKNSTIADFLDALKANGTVDTATWRFIQHLGDIRNKCDHKKTADPTKAEVTDLIEGVRKITKTVF